MDVVSTRGLGKSYGSTTVVEDLNLRVPQGCVYGFLGPNGAGKSTTMKMLLSLIQPSCGEIRIFGREMTRSTRREQLARIGSLIETPPGYGHLTGAENLRIVQRSLGLRDDQIAGAVRTVRLQEQLEKKVRNYSLGMKQRLGIAMALAREPQLLILDEPTNGLDPAGIEEIRGLLRHLADRGVTVVVSSHLLGEIDRTADVLGILNAGRMIFQGTRADLMAATVPDVLVETMDPAAAAETLREKIPARIDGRTLRLPGIDDRSTARVVADLAGAGVGVFGVRRDEQSLEDVFMSLTGGARS
ncbi:ATP-binding cassette domain-containing protein [Tsukamurella serpentis]